MVDNKNNNIFTNSSQINNLSNNSIVTSVNNIMITNKGIFKNLNEKNKNESELESNNFDSEKSFDNKGEIIIINTESKFNSNVYEKNLEEHINNNNENYKINVIKDNNSINNNKNNDFKKENFNFSIIDEINNEKIKNLHEKIFIKQGNDIYEIKNPTLVLVNNKIVTINKNNIVNRIDNSEVEKMMKGEKSNNEDIIITDNKTNKSNCKNKNKKNNNNNSIISEISNSNNNIEFQTNKDNKNYKVPNNKKKSSKFCCF